MREHFEHGARGMSNALGLALVGYLLVMVTVLRPLGIVLLALSALSAVAAVLYVLYAFLCDPRVKQEREVWRIGRKWWTRRDLQNWMDLPNMRLGKETPRRTIEKGEGEKVLSILRQIDDCAFL